MKSKQRVQIIDLFAGPGGLGEGFSNCKADSPFKIAMSVEKESNAHKTLTRRAFYRELKDKAPYYDYIRCDKNNKEAKFEELKLRFPNEWEAAFEETLKKPHALGNSKVFERLKNGEQLTEYDYQKTTVEQDTINTRIKQIKANLGDDRLIVIGGPPCQAYSTMGRGRRQGIEGYNQDYDERFFLYGEYANAIKLAEPDFFIMENVSGIGSAKLADGTLIFNQIINRLEYLDPKHLETSKKKYHVFSLVKPLDEFLGSSNAPIEKDYLIKAVEFGVPQERERVILLGVKDEHLQSFDESFVMSSKSAPEAPSLEETIGGLPQIRSYISSRKDKSNLGYEPVEDNTNNWTRLWQERKSLVDEIFGDAESLEPAIKSAISEILEWDTKSKVFEKEKKYASISESDPEYFIKVTKLTPDEKKDVDLKKEVYEKHIRLVYSKISELNDFSLDEIEGGILEGSDQFIRLDGSRKTFTVEFEKRYTQLFKWLHRDILGVANHNSKKHMAKDLARYMFSAVWTEAAKSSTGSGREVSPSPRTKHFPTSLASSHKSWYSKNFQDRFRTHPRTHRSKTITSHMHKDGHANIHYDPRQNRSITVREAARLQTFPDDYYFEGGQSAQYLQVGNAVPPFLAKQIALHLLKIMKKLDLVNW
jgi:DNA (cytosine-5)-methyltransferase 1